LRKSINIPVHIITYALTNRVTNHLKLFVYLKVNCKGFICYNKNTLRLWAKEIGLSDKTVSNCINWLFKNRWISCNSKREAIHVVSFKKILQKVKRFTLRSVAYFEPRSILDYKYFKAFCCAAAVGCAIRKQKYINSKRSASSKGIAITNRLERKFGFSALANSYLAKYLNVSVSTAFRYKKEACNAGFIEIRKNEKYLRTNGEKISASLINLFKTYNVENGLKTKNGFIIEVLSDSVKSNILIKRKK